MQKQLQGRLSLPILKLMTNTIILLIETGVSIAGTGTAFFLLHRQLKAVHDNIKQSAKISHDALEQKIETVENEVTGEVTRLRNQFANASDELLESVTNGNETLSEKLSVLDKFIHEHAEHLARTTEDLKTHAKNMHDEARVSSIGIRKVPNRN